MSLKTNLRSLLFLILFSGHLSAATPTTKGTEFWVSFMENLNLSSNGLPKLSFLISADVATTGVISLPAIGYTQNYTAAAGQVTQVFLPTGIFYPQGSEHIDSLGFKVTSDHPIGLSVMHNRLYYSDASIVLPVTELADSYMVMPHGDDSSSGGWSEFVVEATEDNTVIDITPSDLTVGLHLQGVAFAVTLNKGQVYQVQSYGDMTGTTIKARFSKKIAVFSGVNYAIIMCQATNHYYEQEYPVASWGQEFMALSLMPFSPDVFRVLASENGTKVYFSCNTPVVLNKGQYFDTLIGFATHIIATAPISVGQFRRGQQCSTTGDASFLMLKPISFCSHKALVMPIQSAIVGFTFDDYYVNVIVRSADTALFTYDNAHVTFTPAGASPEYAFAYIHLPGTGQHTLLSDSGFYANTYGDGPNDAYTYYLGYDAVRPAISGPVSITEPDSLCTSASGTFTATSPLSLNSWNWNFGDGSSSTAQNPSHAYGNNGTYTATLISTDGSGCPSLSQHRVVVYHCPAPGEECDIFVPSAFSPNDDEVNETACVYGTCIKEMEFTIYDRWGQVMFKTNDQSVCWNGMFQGKVLDPAVFAWVLKATLNSGAEIQRKGNISIVK